MDWFLVSIALAINVTLVLIAVVALSSLRATPTQQEHATEVIDRLTIVLRILLRRR